MEDKILEAYVTNLGKYNEGELVGEWVKFPTTQEEMQKVFDRIGINEEYEEIFITDYDCNIYGLTKELGEYESLDKLNYLCGRLEELSSYEREVYESVLESGIGLDEGGIDGLINLTYNLDNYNFISGIESESDLGQYYIDNFMSDAVSQMGELARYIDYEAYGRDVQINEAGMFVDNGYIRNNGDSWNRYFDGSLDDIPEEYRLSGGEEPEAEKEKIIKALVVEPGKKPYMKEIENDYRVLQGEVGGTIQAVYPFQDQVAILCDDEGKFKDYSLNRAMRDDKGEVYDILAGTFLVVGLTEDNFGSLTSEQIKTYSKLYEVPEAFIQIGDSLMILPVEPEEELSRENVQGKMAETVADTFEIYQLKETPEAQELAFMNSRYLEIKGAKIDGANYDKIYEGKLEKDDTLDSLYMKFNVDHPEDFKGHSLSVGDVVVLHQAGRDTAHFVDDFGFKEVPDFIAQVRGQELEDDREVPILDRETRNLEMESLVVPIDPDKKLTDRDMAAYGYEWAGMLPVGNENAEKLYNAGVEMFRLYPDNTEGVVRDLEDLKDHAETGGMFGVEKDTWLSFVDKNPLAKVEELLEDDYGMIDGIINNGDKAKEEKKASIHDKLQAGKDKVKEYDSQKDKMPKQDKQKEKNIEL